MKIVIVLLVCLMVSLSSARQEKLKWSTERCDDTNNRVSGSYPGVTTCTDFCKSLYYDGPIANIGACLVKEEGMAYCKCGIF